MATTHADPTTGIEPAPAESAGGGKIVCNACPVLCNITLGRSGACDRYANLDGVLTRVDPLVLARRTMALVPLAEAIGSGGAWDAQARALPADAEGDYFVTGIGATTTYPDYKPAPFIVAAEHEGVDTVTVVTEGIFSYCSFKVKIDTDRYIGPEQAPVRCGGEIVGHVTTAEYGSQMLSLGGVHHLTGGSKREGRVTCQMMMDLGNKKPVELEVEGGASLVVAAGRAPVINGAPEKRMRVGCGSATIGIFAPQWKEHVDEVIVVDDHITGVLTEHQAGKYIEMKPAGIKIKGKKSTPGRYFQVANPGLGWGGTDITDPLSIIDKVDQKIAWPGLRVLFVSTTGEDSAISSDLPCGIPSAMSNRMTSPSSLSPIRWASVPPI